MWMDAVKAKQWQDTMKRDAWVKCCWKEFFETESEKEKIEDKKTAVSKFNNKNEARGTGMPPRVSKPGTHR